MESGKGIKGMQEPAGVPATKKKQKQSPLPSCDKDKRHSQRGSPIAHRKSTSCKTPRPSQAQAPVAPQNALSKSVIEEMVTIFLQQKTSRQDKTTSPLPQEALQRLEKELNRQIKDSESFKRLSLEDKIDLYIILAVLREQLGKPSARDKVIKALQAVKPELLSERLTLLVWLGLPAITAPSQEGGEQVSKFIKLALKTGFPPALWQALRLSIQPGGCEAISPSLAINILQRLNQTASSLPQILALGGGQVERYLATGDLQRSVPFSEHDQFLYLMAQCLDTGQSQEDDANIWTLPEEVRSELANILAFSIQQLSRSPSEPDTRLEKAIESGEGIELSFEHLMHFINKKALGLPEYQKAITLLLATGASDLCDSQTASKNRRNAMVNQVELLPWLAAAGRAGKFPQLLQEAADRYEAIGFITHRDICLSQLREMRQSSLPPHASTDMGQSSLMPTVVQELEAEADAPEHLKIDMAETPLPEKKQKKKKNQKGAKKTTQAVQSNAVSQKPPSEHQPPASTVQTEIKRLMPPSSSAVVEEVATNEPIQDTLQPSPAESIEFSDELTQDSGYHSQGSSSPEPGRVDSPTASTSVDSAARPKTQLSRMTYAPEGGWLSDSSHEIRSFIQSIEHFRSKGDTEGEKEFLEQQLEKYKNTPAYGRICEEAAWFYLHQFEENPHLEPLYLKQDHPEIHEQDTLLLAEQWANRALCCYFQRGIPSNISPSRHKRLITEYYDEHPEMAANPEFRKSVCSICSTLGHIYSYLASSSHGKAKNSLGKKARDFFSLKPLADFTNTGHAPKSTEPKLTTITREQAERTRRS